MGVRICMGDEHHRYYKHTKFCQNPRGDHTISCVDFTWNDPYATLGTNNLSISQVFKYKPRGHLANPGKPVPLPINP